MFDQGAAEREFLNANMACGLAPHVPRVIGDKGLDGCGARDWRLFVSPQLDIEAGERIVVCQGCGAEFVLEIHIPTEPMVYPPGPLEPWQP